MTANPIITRQIVTACGAEISWDNEAKAGFICVEHGFPKEGWPGCAWASRRQVELRPGLIIDLDADGHVRGIETIGWEAGIFDLLDVIRWQSRAHELTREELAVADRQYHELLDRQGGEPVTTDRDAEASERDVR